MSVQLFSKIFEQIGTDVSELIQNFITILMTPLNQSYDRKLFVGEVSSLDLMMDQSGMSLVAENDLLSSRFLASQLVGFTLNYSDYFKVIYIYLF